MFGLRKLALAALFDAEVGFRYFGGHFHQRLRVEFRIRGISAMHQNAFFANEDSAAAAV